jgi:hypothetical protein
MQRIPADLNAFMQQKLIRFAANESATVDLCCNYLRMHQFECNADMAQAAATLFIKLDSWGHYPSKLVACCLSWKFKTCFEELKDPTQTELLLKILAKVLDEQPHPNIARLYLGLILAQKVHNLNDKEVVKVVVIACIKNLRRHQELDRLINLILIKFTLKVSDHIKELKYSIALCSMQFVIAVVSRAYLNSLEPSATLKPLMEYLKLLVALGKEIASRSPEDQNKNDDSYAQMICLLTRILILNLTLSPRQPQDSMSEFIYYNISHAYVARVFDHELVQQVRISTEELQFMGVNSTSCLQPAFPQLEQEVELTHVVDQPLEIDVLEKIKVNSIKLLMVVARNFPEVFDYPDIHEMIFPAELKSLDCKQVYTNPGFYPARLFTYNFTESVSHLYGQSVINLTGTQIKFQSQGRSAISFLADTRCTIREKLSKSNGSSRQEAVSMIAAVMNEQKVEMKVLFMECLGVIHLNLYKLTQSEYSGTIRPPESSRKVQYAISSFREWGVAILLVYFVELFSCKSYQFRLILEGIATCPTDSMFMHIPNKMVERLLDYFVIPVLATCVHCDYEFLPQFDRFLETIFEAGFSEYFLSKINYIKATVETMITYCSIQIGKHEDSISNSTKIKVVLVLVEELLEKYPSEMLDLLRLITGFVKSVVLIRCDPSTSNNDSISLQHFGPQILEKISTLDKRFPVDRRSCLSQGICAADDWQHTLSKKFASSTTQKCLVFMEDSSSSGRFSQADSYSSALIARDYIHSLYESVIVYAATYPIKDRFEKSLVSAMLSIDPTELRLLEPTLLRHHNISIQQFLAKLLEEMKNQKSKLLIIEHILSCKLELVVGLRKKMWANLFSMYSDKTLSVEIVFTNYNIIYGLRHFPKLIEDEQLQEIVNHTVQALKSKNRKLLNNCLKIFGYILGFYSFGILKWIIDSEVPNVFYEEMQGEEEKRSLKLSGSKFVALLLKKFNSHKYSKYNIVAISSAILIVKRHDSSQLPESRSLVDTLLSELKCVLIDKIALNQSFKYHSLACILMGRETALRYLTRAELQFFATSGLAMLVASLETDINSLSSEYHYWNELKAKGFVHFLNIYSYICNLTETTSHILQIHEWISKQGNYLISWIRKLISTYDLDSSEGENSDPGHRIILCRKTATEFDASKIRISAKQRKHTKFQLISFLTSFICWIENWNSTLNTYNVETPSTTLCTSRAQSICFQSIQEMREIVSSIQGEIQIYEVERIGELQCINHRKLS